jgi:hypothetical protein
VVATSWILALAQLLNVFSSYAAIQPALTRCLSSSLAAGVAIIAQTNADDEFNVQIKVEKIVAL